MRILGIETSCDETAASVIEGKGNKVKVLSNIISSQIEIHQKYGGVVPEVAAREHVLNMLPVVNEALTAASLDKKSAKNKLDAIAVTAGPGLITSLIVGVETAKTLAYSWNLPIISVNHIEGHIYSNFIDTQIENFPILILTVSGGHTILVLMKNHGEFEVLGETRDDAAGEAFDKAAQLMNIGYPGGPVVSKNAALADVKVASNIKLPRPMLNEPGFEFSFSGLKTAILYEIKKDKDWKKKIPEYCYQFQQAVIDVLVGKTIKAAAKHQVKAICLSGGVSANKELRVQLGEAISKKFPGMDYHVPDLKYTTDNAVMIAVNGYYKALRKKFTPWQKIRVDANLEL